MCVEAIEKDFSVDDAWYIGYDDYLRGFSPEHCPYHAADLRSAWLDGWEDAKENGYY